MKYQLLGKSGLRVSELCLGAMTFGEEWGWGASKEESRKIFNAYVDTGGNHSKNMKQSLEASLKRLKTDYIDLYWVHAWDPLTPIEETIRALDDMVRAGKILYIGISDAPAWIVSQANTLANLSGWTEFAGIQIQYSLIERTPERELLPMASALDMGVTAWSPLGGGVLTGKYNKNNEEEEEEEQQ